MTWTCDPIANTQAAFALFPFDAADSGLAEATRMLRLRLGFLGMPAEEIKTKVGDICRQLRTMLLVVGVPAGEIEATIAATA